MPVYLILQWGALESSILDTTIHSDNTYVPSKQGFYMCIFCTGRAKNVGLKIRNAQLLCNHEFSLCVFQWKYEAYIDLIIEI